MLTVLQQENPYLALDEKVKSLLDPIVIHIQERSLPVSVSRLGSMFTFFFCPELPQNFQEAKKADTAAYAKFFWNLLENGVYIACSQFETNFVGTMHDRKDLDFARDRFLKALTTLY